MNKKALIGIIALIIVAVVGGIFFITYQNNDIDNANNQNYIDEQQEEQDMKILVAVFSRAGENYAVGNIEVGNTEVMANYIAAYTKGDLFKITPVNPYPEGYEDTKTIATQELNSNARPQIANKVQNFDDYDVIFIGYPIWYGTYPMIINTFLESYNFDGKIIIPFNTHEGSGDSGTFSSIKSKMSNSTIMDGLAVRGLSANNSKSEVENWLKKLGF